MTSPTKAIEEIEDLMDQVTLEGHGETDKEILQQIANQINAFLDPANPDSVNNDLIHIKESSTKIDGLYSQLSHHTKQAKANSENLENHITYLRGQVEAIRSLNNNLAELDKVNAQAPDEVHTKQGGQHMLLDDIVLPDLSLVHQLYDTTAEIKAHKDVIRLVGGSFKSEDELISNDNLDACTRAVRSAARELFWLEVTRMEIGKIMGLLV